MKNFCVITFILLSLLSSCSCKKRKEQKNEKELVVPVLVVKDSVYLSNLKTLIASSSCFEIHKDRRMFDLIYCSSLEYKNLLYVSLSRHRYCGLENEDFENIYGGFYSKIEEKSYLFLVAKSEYISPLLFEKTDRAMDISSYIGLEMASDAEWYINENENELELIYIHCP